MDGGENDLDDVIREEISRGRRPINSQAWRDRQLLMRGFRQLLREKNEQKFLKAIRSLGLQDGSPEFVQALKIWREFFQHRIQSS